MKRPILIALIGYIIGILWGLYLKTSIVLFCIIIIVSYKIITKRTQKPKNFLFYAKHKKKIRKAKKYIEAKSSKKAIILILCCAVVSNKIVKIQNKQYDEKFKNISQGTFIATVVEEKKESEYNKQYKIKVDSNTYLILKVKDKNSIPLCSKIQFIGKFEELSQQRNYKGFDYKEHLKTKKIYGIVTTNSVKIIKQNNLNFLQNLASKITNYMQNNLKKQILDKVQYHLLMGLLLGADDNLEKEIKDDFKNSSLSHILAVSGMHVSYIILFVSRIVTKAKLSRKISQAITIVILILLTCMTGFSSSVIRAVIMSMLGIGAEWLYKKSDVLNNISIALFINLLNNPFCIKDIGLLLSFTGTIGIILFQKQILNQFYHKNRELALAKKLTVLEKFYKKIVEIAIVSISAQLCILPIMIYYFNQISFSFLLSNILASFLIGPIILIGFILAIFTLPILPNIMEILLSLLIHVAKIVSQLPLSQITVVTPSLITMFIYYLVLYLIYTHMWKSKLKLSTIVHNLRNYVNKKRKMLITITILLLIIQLIYTNFPKGITIHFIDVGQGDSTLILANNKKILIDGGGSNNQEFDIGERTLVPYLLDRKIKTLDYIFISHFDTDHVRTDY